MTDLVCVMMTPATLVVMLLLVVVPVSTLLMLVVMGVPVPTLLLLLPARPLPQQVHCLHNPRHQDPQSLCRAARKLAGPETHR